MEHKDYTPLVSDWRIGQLKVRGLMSERPREMNYEEGAHDVRAIYEEARQQDHATIAQLREEVESLRDWKTSAIDVMLEWDKVHAALGSPGKLGESMAASSLNEVNVLRMAMGNVLRHTGRPDKSDTSPSGRSSDIDLLNGLLDSIHRISATALSPEPETPE